MLQSACEVPTLFNFVPSLKKNIDCRYCCLFAEPEPKAGHPEEETATDKDRSQLGAFLPQVSSRLWAALNRMHFLLLLTTLTTSSAAQRFQLDHAQSNLIWNLKTREELRDALEAEMRAFSVDRELGSANVISWNHQEFEVCASSDFAGMFATKQRLDAVNVGHVGRGRGR